LSDLAAAHQLSVYDAAYQELARRRNLVLGCKDGPPANDGQARGRQTVGLR
jgi:hypothetical protein